MNTTANFIKQRLSLREPLAEALDVVAKISDTLDLKKPDAGADYAAYLEDQLAKAKTVCPTCRDFERDFPSFAFSIATGIGKTRLMGACIAYLYMAKGIKHFFVLAPNLTLYEKLKRDFGDPSYEKYVFKGIAEFVSKPPIVIDGDNYNNFQLHGGNLVDAVEINVFNIAKFNTDSKESKRGAPRMRRLSEYLGQSYFDYLASLPDLVILMDEAHRYHADASKKAINELHPILGLEMTATPTDEKGKSFKNIVYEYNLAQALDDGKYVKIPTVAKRRNYRKGDLTDKEVDIMKLEDAISIHKNTKKHLELYSKDHNCELVKPFILVVCKNIAHAEETKKLLEEELFNGEFKGKVLQIDSSTKKEEEVDRLFVSLEKPDNEIEIVIHVNMLKEGWDVTNLYTIVPLRTADAPILVEQSIGRGLRLPYGGKRTGVRDVDTLTVIAHDNFEAVIAAAQKGNSVLKRLSYIDIEDQDYITEKSEVVNAQTQFDFKIQEIQEKAKTETEKKAAEVVCDARKAAWEVISDMPRLMGQSLSAIGQTLIHTKEDLKKPEMVNIIKQCTIQKIEQEAQKESPLFAEEYAKPRIEEVEQVIQKIIYDYVENIIEIPRMTVQREQFKAEYKWFDLDTRIGFDYPSTPEEIIRQGLVDKVTEIMSVESGRTYDDPVDQIVSELINYDDVDYDENADLLYYLAEAAYKAIEEHADNKKDAPRIVYNFRKGIAKTIYEQMKAHFVIESLGYSKPKVLPFTGIVQQHLIAVEGFGRIDYRTVVKPALVRKFIYTGFLKSYYTESKFDSTTELDFANVLETDNAVLRWLRPAPTQFNIYWGNGAHRYEPDFVVETADAIYLVETKAANNLEDPDVLAKKKAALEYCKNASEYTAANGGKPWKYALLAHDVVDRTSSFQYLMAFA